MIVHLLKLVWHRKTANALVATEIFFSFLIVFAVVTLAVSSAARWAAPIGFSWQNIWVMSVEPVIQGEHSTMRKGAPFNAAAEETHARQVTEATERLLRELRSFPQIEAAAADTMPPYADREWQTVYGVNGRRVLVTADKAGDDFARVMNLQLVAGRWFSRADEGQSYVPIVIDSDAAKAMFGTTDAVGRKFDDDHFGTSGTKHELRVVGVIKPYRLQGEFSPLHMRMVFFRSSVADAWDPAPNAIVMRLRPGTPASFEAELNRRLHPESADVAFRISRMESMRRTAMKMRMAPVVALAVVALFLVSMVALGLTGVLWQTVTRRMREIGLRRAVGATGRQVRRQVLLEVALLATLAVSVGVIVVLQLPLLGFTRFVSPGEFAMGFVSALAVIYAITLLCGAYPSWLASRIDPAEALRYE